MEHQTLNRISCFGYTRPWPAPILPDLIHDTRFEAVSSFPALPHCGSCLKGTCLCDEPPSPHVPDKGTPISGAHVKNESDTR